MLDRSSLGSHVGGFPNTIMGKQYNKVEKRQRRKKYMLRRRERELAERAEKVKARAKN